MNSRDCDPMAYRFRDLHPNVRLGTASDRYAGWVGQIYTEAAYQGRITSRSHHVGGKSFKEQVLPVDSVKEYFEHFPVLEVDYTFYQPLLDEEGRPGKGYQVLKAYAGHMTSADGLFLKVPQAVFAQKIRIGDRYRPNPGYLDAELFRRRFYEPAVELLGSRIMGFIFEQEYQRRDERTPIKALADALRAFFGTVPADPRYHVELRTESYLEPRVFAVMEEFGIGQVLSHWTWLPPLRKQFERSGNRFLNASRQGLIRLMTPIGIRYEDAYARAFPFDRLVDGMLQPSMIEDTVDIMQEAARRDVKLSVIINNRAGGNAPQIARLIAARFLKEIGSVRYH